MTQDKTPLPFFLGSAKADVHRALGGAGHVDGLGQFYDSYPSLGIAVAYDEREAVRSIYVSNPSLGGSQRYLLLGVSVGDNEQSYLPIIGHPVKTVVYSWARFFVWNDNDLWIKLETEVKDGDVGPWGPQHVGDIKSIEVSTEPPHVYFEDGPAASG